MPHFPVRNAVVPAYIKDPPQAPLIQSINLSEQHRGKKTSKYKTSCCRPAELVIVHRNYWFLFENLKNRNVMLFWKKFWAPYCSGVMRMSCEGPGLAEDDMDWKVCWGSEKWPNGVAGTETDPRNISAVQWGRLTSSDHSNFLSLYHFWNF